MGNMVSYGGLGVQSAAFQMDDATICAIGSNYDGAVGKAVAVTAGGTVGYGTSGRPVFGFIVKADARGIATVQYRGFREDVPIPTAAANQPAAGGKVCVDGAGGIVKPTENAEASGTVFLADNASKTAIILL